MGEVWAGEGGGWEEVGGEGGVEEVFRGMMILWVLNGGVGSGGKGLFYEER